MELTYGIESTTHVTESKSKAPITQVTKKARTPEVVLESNSIYSSLDIMHRTSEGYLTATSLGERTSALAR